MTTNKLNNFFSIRNNQENLSTKKTSLPSPTLPWIEKYRPKTVNDVSHQDEVVKTLKTSISSGTLPHLLFYGPPGTGKTSTILAMAREFYGPNFRKTGRVLELNASDERGIPVVRGKIKSFAQGALSNTPDMPPFKLIILDEADSMTGDAQAALRRMIENYSKVTRFCLICNYVSRIIEPLASRCAKFRFQPLQSESMLLRLKYICKNEDIVCENEDKVLNTILEYSGGDLRKAINYLQSARQVKGNTITSKEIIRLAGVLPDNYLQVFWETIEKNEFDLLQKEMNIIFSDGYPVDVIFNQFLKEICHFNNDKISDTKKAYMALRLAEADKKLTEGADEYLQLMDVSTYIMSTYHHCP